jgi:hypothetical protein
MAATGLATFQGIWNLFTNEPFIPYIAERLPYWAQIVSPIIFGSIFIASIIFVVKVHQLNVLYKTNKGLAVAKHFVCILEKVEKRDLRLKDAAVRQYKTLFSRNDLLALCNSIASTDNEYVEFRKSIESDGESKELRKDTIERRKQIDSAFERMRPIYEKQWTLQRLVANANKLDRFPKIQNSSYNGIKTRRERDKRWRKLFANLSSVKEEFPEIFIDNELGSMIDDYVDMSFGGASKCLFAELMNWYIPVDCQPTAYIDSGMYAPHTTIQNEMVQLRLDISNKIIELAAKPDKELETTSKINDEAVKQI